MPHAIRRALLAVVATVPLLTAGLALVAAPAEAATYRPADSCPVAAHRGDHHRATENSLRAMQIAAADGVNYLEMDVQVSRDGHFVLMHDPTIDRTTRGSATGRVIDQTYARLRSYRLDDGQRIPALSEVITAVRDTKVKAFVEIKFIPRSRWPLLVHRLGVLGLDRVVVNSFVGSDLLAFHAAYPQITVALDADVRPTTSYARRFDAVMIDHRVLTDAWMREMSSAGVPVAVWTEDTATLWRRWAGQVAVTITNEQWDFRSWRRSYCTGVPLSPTAARFTP